MSIAFQTMIQTDRQKKFREKYVNEISPFYNGLVHIGVMYAVGISLIWYGSHGLVHGLSSNLGCLLCLTLPATFNAMPTIHPTLIENKLPT